MRRMSRLLASLLAITCLATRPAHAAWPHDPYANLPLCLAGGVQIQPQIVPDGSGGAISVWQDSRAGNNDIYAQRVSAAGVTLWTTNGVVVCSAAGSQQFPKAVPDGAGGVIVAWEDVRAGNSDIYAQRVDANGVPQWTANGVAVCVQTSIQNTVSLAVDTDGSTVLGWTDARAGGSDIWAQRLSAAGAPQWIADGIAICSAAGAQRNVRVVRSAPGNWILVWEDPRNAGTALDIYAQRVTAPGTLQWALDGEVVTNENFDQLQMVALPDGANGAFVAWADFRSGSGVADIYAQRLSVSGTALWSSTDVPVCVASNHQAAPVMAPDGQGGIFVAWVDSRLALSDGVYAQRLAPSSATVWTADGIPLRTGVPLSVSSPSIASDGALGMLAVWMDARGASSYDLYAQRVSASGASQWQSQGVLVSGALNWQQQPAIVGDGDAGGIVVWSDERNGAAADEIYCQRIERYGQLGDPEATITQVRDVAADQGGHVRVSWTASYLDVDPEYDITDYRVWRQVPVGTGRALALSRGLTEDADAAAATGALLLAPLGTQDVAWELAGTQTADALPAYSLTMATTGDSSAAGNPYTVFMIEARATTSIASDRWYSAPDSGYSVDNLAPATPAPFTGVYAGGSNVLTWNANTEPDLAGYRLHRGPGVSFVPNAGTLVSAQGSTGFVDAAGGPYVYRLSAVDVHGNESPFATLIPAGALDADRHAPSTVALSAPSPNPVRGEGVLRFALPRASHVSLALFDPNGREVLSLVRGERDAGEHAVRWSARDADGRALPAGVYFARLVAGGRSLVRRVIVTP